MVAGQIGSRPSGGSLVGKVLGGVGDFLGFDGEFGYQGARVGVVAGGSSYGPSGNGDPIGDLIQIQTRALDAGRANGTNDFWYEGFTADNKSVRLDAPTFENGDWKFKGLYENTATQFTYDGLNSGGGYSLIQGGGPRNATVDEITVTAQRQAKGGFFTQYLSDFGRGFSFNGARPQQRTAPTLSGLSTMAYVDSNYRYRIGEARQTALQGSYYLDRQSVLNSPAENFGLAVNGRLTQAQAVLQGIGARPASLLDTVMSLGRGEGFAATPVTRQDSNNLQLLAGVATLGEGSVLSVGRGGLVGARSGAVFEGGLYRAVPDGGNPLDMSFSVNANGRYTAPGQGGLYFASGAGIVDAEFVNNGSSLVGKTMHSFPNSSVDNLLDLTNPTTRANLGVSLSDLTRTGVTSQWRYEVTQPLGAYAQQQGFSGIIAPSAQADGGVNLILFGARGVR